MYEIYDFSQKMIMRTDDRERANRCYFEWPHAAMLVWRWEGLDIMEQKSEARGSCEAGELKETEITEVRGAY